MTITPSGANRAATYRLMIWGKNVTNSFIVTNRNLSFDGVVQ
jgi:hypothetical protein